MVDEAAAVAYDHRAARIVKRPQHRGTAAFIGSLARPPSIRDLARRIRY